MSAPTSFVRQTCSQFVSPTQRWWPIAFLARRLARVGSPTQGALGRRKPERSTVGAVPPSDGQLLAFAELCRILERPFALAEIRAVAPAVDGGLGVGGILLAAARLGFKARALKPHRHNLAGAPLPFLLVSRVPGEALVATGRVQDHLLLLEPSSGRTTACSLEAVADLAERIVLMKPQSEPAPAGLRDTMFARLRPVLWELGIASVVINLLALATPLFLMTVYNTVTG